MKIDFADVEDGFPLAKYRAGKKADRYFPKNQKAADHKKSAAFFIKQFTFDAKDFVNLLWAKPKNKSCTVCFGGRTVLK